MTPLIEYLRANSIEVINLAIGLVGFVLLGIQVWKARSAAEAAKRASNLAFERVLERTTLADIYSIAGMLREIKGALRDSNWQQALFRCEQVRTELHKLRTRDEFASSERRQEIQEIIIGLRKLQDKLEKAVSDGTLAIDPPTANRGLSDYASRLYEMAEKLKFARRETES